MVKLHGNAPYKIVTIHGGPGACGSLGNLSKLLLSGFGVAEQIQSRYTLSGLMLELEEDLNKLPSGIVLIGHSFGAWLAIWYASKFPDHVRELILLGSAPVEDQYANTIRENRKRKLTDADEIRLRELSKRLHNCSLDQKDSYFYQLSAFYYYLDGYRPMPYKLLGGNPNFKMFHKIWPLAASLRSENQIIGWVKKLRVPISIFHGTHDPHPIEGITEPLDKYKIPYRFYPLKNAGHYPWMEKKTGSTFLTKFIHHLNKI